MKTDQIQRKFLNQYQPPDFTIDKTDLEFSLNEGVTTVTSRLSMRRVTTDQQAPLKLDGVELKLIDIQLDNTYLDDSDYRYDGEVLTIAQVPHEFELVTQVQIDPAQNKSLEGLYQSNGNYCTQCEAEGFRHITFYLDRPDVMSVFTTTLWADKVKYPVLLSNGNKVDAGDADDRHWVKWFDPYPKPCYLFALVAGDLAQVSGHFTTRSGREVALEFFTEHHNREKCGHAIESLKKAMAWDEQVYGLEYDLDLYMVVAVDDFNMGAMENKGLNVFNTKYVLANQQTATDTDYLNIEGVIAHEYFHNWTGNRVTCRDWFQLSLKEGLTVFRDQEFSADMTSRAIQRINDVRVLRSHQFTEDAGPMAHPVRPASYLEINNFYTTTVYNKGAEVVRMYQTLLGKQGFRKGMDLYFQRHDGQAVTTDDFRMAMQDANDFDLTQFQRWYEQSGTPVVHIERIYDAMSKQLTLWVRQDAGATKGEPNLPFHIPMKLALYDHQGNALALNAQGDSELVISITEANQKLVFDDIPEHALVSAFREFSAPVIVKTDLKPDELALLMSFDSDAFNQWDAGQQYATQVMLELIAATEITVTDKLEGLLSAIEALLNNSEIDKPLLAEMLCLPGEKYLAEQSTPIDVHKIHRVREFVKSLIAERFEQQILALYQAMQDSAEYRIDHQSIGRRTLKNVCLGYLTQLQKGEYFELAKAQFESATNMTDQMGALNSMVDYKNDIRDAMFDSFYQQWSDTALVVDKWFSAQASASYPDALNEILSLEQHEAFNLMNPNRARSLIGAFQANNVVFHDTSGQGYQFLADKVMELDSFNPQVASRMAGAFLNWKKLVPELAESMKAQILRIQSKPGLSNDVAELMSSCLAEE